MPGGVAIARLFPIVSLLASTSAGAQTPDVAMANARRLVAGDACGGGDRLGDVVVCARSDAGERYRLPPSTRRADAVAAVRDGTSPIAAITSHAPCGIFAGERRCGKREARAYGYGGGRDPLTLGGRLVARLLDPDAEIEPVR